MTNIRFSRGAALAAPVLFAATFLAALSGAQPAPPNGPRDVASAWHAITHASVITKPGERMEDATIVVRNGVIVSVTKGGGAPAGARVWDATGLTVYPGFIDAYVPVDAPAPDAKAPGAHWNAKVTPQRSALDGAGLDEKSRKAWRDLGFTAAALAPKGGVFRGEGAVVSLADPAEASESKPAALRAGAFQAIALETGGFGVDAYPGSQMGAIALVRQTLADAAWREADLASYREDPTKRARPLPADALDALAPSRAKHAPLLFAVNDELEALRVAKIASEFSRSAMFVGTGTELRRLDAVVGTGLPMIIPVAFPETPKVESISDQEHVDLRELMLWEQAPTNLRRLDGAGATVALTLDRLKKKDDFWKNLREAVRHGLSEDRALTMLTMTPAKLYGLEGRLGQVAPGFAANLVVVEGSMFDSKSKIRDVWVDGERYEVSAAPGVKAEGTWTVSMHGAPADAPGVTLTIAKGNKISLTLPPQEGEADEAKPEGDEAKEPKPRKLDARSVRLVENRLSYLVDGKEFGSEGVVSVSAIIEGDLMTGVARTADGAQHGWSARRADAAPGEEEKKDDAKDEDASAPTDVPESLGLPFGAYAMDTLPEQEDVFFTNGTIWTGGPEGTIEQGSMHVKNGKIVAVGKGLKAPSGARVVDLGGRHVTPGIIDCHSHTGISGSVNEGTQAITAEVRIFDVIDPDDVSWYWQLAGGVTAVNQLHGSANPIGGQNSVVKLRWGVKHPDEMRLEGAPGGIKFALGENVKQSNWGERTTRYPASRMGVEAIIRDAFDGAREYADGFARWEAMSAAQRKGLEPPRRDLEREALLEILRGSRLVHCHSYRQDEILMLCRVAHDYSFTIGTFQHVLEGYKVADAIKSAARGGSCFSDWWAYKFEVIDAIPEDGAIMHEVGVPVSFNSDSDELARRLNVEAGKAVKYGGVAPDEAIKFVTYNPAYQLAAQGMVGSLEPKKDADLAIWSGHPMSSMSRCESTWIDGREYFSLEKDQAHRARNTSERQRIIQKALAKGSKKTETSAGERGADGERPAGRRRPGAPTAVEESEWERIQQALERRYLDRLRAGLDPEGHDCGDCGSLNLHEH